MTRSPKPRSYDLIHLLEAAGRRASAWVNQHLERRPVVLPVAFMGLGVALLAAGAIVGGPADGPARASGGGSGALALASLLFALGGLGLLVGVAGLLSALVVHIVRRRERRP